MRRGVAILSIALITAGIVVLADVGATLAWEEPLSSAYGWWKQNVAENQLNDLESSYPTKAQLRAARRGDPLDSAKILAKGYRKRIHIGEGIGRIKIPRIGLGIVMVQGTDTATLQKGPGHYPTTPLPGQGGTVGIAGHRTTYLAPFRHIDDLQKGDPVIIEMPYGTFTYKVRRARIVDPGDVGIIHRTKHEQIVMTACHPLYSAVHRYAVFARLDRVQFARVS